MTLSPIAPMQLTLEEGRRALAAQRPDVEPEQPKRRRRSEERPDVAKVPLRDRFELYHQQHPEVYERLVRLTRLTKRRQIARGVPAEKVRLGIANLFEVLRWLDDLRVHGFGGASLNNSYRAYYARKIMRNHKDLRGIFETRKQAEPKQSDREEHAKDQEAGEGV